MSAEKVMLGTAPVVIANRYKDLLEAQSIQIALAYNVSTCKTGCSHTMEIWAEAKDVDQVVAFIRQDSSRNFEGLEFDPNIVNQVFDTSKDEAQCPACGTLFKTSAAECPDCGLGFSVSD